jgi:4-amino-4-deoxy-L-arabinose transferase-like glycosyltransferase
MGRRRRRGKPQAPQGSQARASLAERTRALRDSVTAGLRHRHALLVILLLAAALRALHLWALSRTLWWNHLDLDPKAYDEWAQRIAAGDWVGTRPFFVDPLYAYFLAALYKLTGHNLLVVRLCQLGFGVATCALVATTGQRLFSLAAGRLAALLYAIYKPALFYEANIEKTALATVLCLAGLGLVLRRRAAAVAFGGAALGLATLARANLLVAGPLALGFLLWRGRPRERASLALAFAAGMVAVLGPCLLRNHHLGGGFVLTSSAGQNFYLGNNPLNPVGGYGYLPFVRPYPALEEVDFAREAERRTGGKLSTGEVSRFWRREALAYLRAEPLAAARVFGNKVLLLLTDYEVPDDQDPYFLAKYSRVLALPLPSFGSLLPLALIGMVALGEPKRTEARLVLWFLPAYGLAVASFFVLARFRMPAVPVLALFAAAGLRWLVTRARARRAGLAVAGVAAAVALLSFYDLPFYSREANTSHAWHNLAALQLGAGRAADARASLVEALRVNPGNDIAWQDLGMLDLASENYRTAETSLLTSVRLNPERPDAWALLAQLYQRTGRAEQAQKASAHALPGGAAPTPP